jgi:hypothetical protein
MADEEPAGRSEDELLEQLQKELTELKVSDVLVQTVFTVSSLGYRRLGEEDRDLDDARLAIDALRALLPVLARAAPADTIRDIEQLVANMQLAYARAVGAG